jgi:hypothetical protein
MPSSHTPPVREVGPASPAGFLAERVCIDIEGLFRPVRNAPEAALPGIALARQTCAR